jgi:hypothetical protein
MLGRCAIVLCILGSAGVARAEFVSLERWLLPADVADRVEGSGIKGRTLAHNSERHDFDVAEAQLRVTPALAVRGGIGVASYTSLDTNKNGVAFAGGATYAFGEVHGFRLQIDVEATRATYGGGVLTDATVLVAIGRSDGRP